MKTAGWTLIALGVAVFLFNAMDTIADLKAWHDATNPQIVAALGKQAASVIMAAIGGTLVPVPGGSK